MMWLRVCIHCSKCGGDVKKTDTISDETLCELEYLFWSINNNNNNNCSKYLRTPIIYHTTYEQTNDLLVKFQR